MTARSNKITKRNLCKMPGLFIKVSPDRSSEPARIEYEIRGGQPSRARWNANANRIDGKPREKSACSLRHCGLPEAGAVRVVTNGWVERVGGNIARWPWA